LARRVLLIDDSRTMREVLKVYLMGGKYEFEEAESAQRALEILRTTQVDLVIADINMPNMDGFELLEVIRSSELPTVRAVPIVLVTSDKTEAMKKRIRDSKADAFLQKPIQADRLVDTVERLVRERPA
jgi:CheY-like chemotaxis protein